jgi:hypothetical protein
MNMRRNTKGDNMYAAEIQFLPPIDPTDWSDPQIRITSVCIDQRDGAPYYEPNPTDSFRLSELVASGIYTQDEADLVVGLILKAYILRGSVENGD